MSLSRDIRLRYRADGHLRFDLPPRLRDAECAEELTRSLESQEGIYRVNLSTERGKLSIRYLPTICDFATVVHCLHGVVDSLQKRKTVHPRSVSSRVTGRALSVISPSLPHSVGIWLQSKWQELRETALAIKILAQQAMGPGATAMTRRPRWLREFMNDLLMLYLIKLHWHHILTEWLPRPWTHRYEWAATIYLIHLSVQARLTQQRT